jgi:hypothetical protein
MFRVHIHYRWLLLLIAASCFSRDKQQLFFSENNQKEEKEEKDMQVKQQCSGGCQGFLKKYYPKRSGGVEIFLSRLSCPCKHVFPA